VKGDDAQRGVLDMNRRIVTETDKGNRILPLPFKDESVYNPDRSVAASECPDAIDCRIVDGCLQVGKAIVIGSREVPPPRSSGRAKNRLEPKPAALVLGTRDSVGVDRPSWGHKRHTRSLEQSPWPDPRRRLGQRGGS